MTDIQRQRVIAAYKGKWLRFQGEVHNVREDSKIMNIFLDASSVREDRYLSLSFDKTTWEAQLETLKKGDRIEGEGIVEDIDSPVSRLKDCIVTRIST